MSKIDTYVWNETRFKTLRDADPDRANALLGKSKASVERKYKEYRYLADRPF